MNNALTLARLHRIADFLAAVEGAIKKPARTRINRLKKYTVAINAAKSDVLIRPIAEDCAMILDIMTDGRELTDDKIQSLRELHADIERMVKQ